MLPSRPDVGSGLPPNGRNVPRGPVQRQWSGTLAGGDMIQRSASDVGLGIGGMGAADRLLRDKRKSIAMMRRDSTSVRFPSKYRKHLSQQRVQQHQQKRRQSSVNNKPATRAPKSPQRQLSTMTLTWAKPTSTTCTSPTAPKWCPSAATACPCSTATSA